MADKAKNARAELSTFCKRLQKDISVMIEKAAGDSEKEIILTVYLEKFKTICSDIESGNLHSITEVVSSKYLQTITQLVLDLTYVDECSLVDEEFPEESAYHRVIHILESLHSVESLAKKVICDKSTLQVLGSDVLECLCWRKGALLYMYCHTLNSRCSSQDLPTHFTQFLEDGVKFLTSMLSTRSSPKWLSQPSSDDVDKNFDGKDDDETSQLLAQGILSDTHLLALMYCGEMCYWHTQASREQSACSDEKPANNKPVTSTQVCSDNCIEGTAQPSGDKAYCGSPETSAESAASVPQTDTVSVTNISNASITNTGNASVTETSSTDVYSYENSCDNDIPSCVLGANPSLDMVRIGQLSLENYVRAAQGPMLAGGWNTTRAEEILQFFTNLKR